MEQVSTLSPWAEQGGQNVMGQISQGMQGGAQPMPPEMFQQWLAASQVDPMSQMGANVMSQMYGGGFGGGNPYQMPQPGMGQGMPRGMAGQGMPMGMGQQPSPFANMPPGFDPFAARR